MKYSRLVVMGLVACGGGGGKQPAPDAAVDAAIAIDAPPDAAQMIGTAMSHTLYVNTQGITVMAGADDATANTSSLATSTATLLGFLASDPQRQTKIDALVAELQTILAPYHIAIVTSRPAAGPYDMLVVTDSGPQALGLSAGISAITPTTCNSTASVIGFDFGVQGTVDANAMHLIARNGIAMFGVENGIPLAKKQGDCMCLVDQTCSSATLTAACTIGGAGTMIDSTAACGVSGMKMDEGALFLQAFGPH